MRVCLRLTKYGHAVAPMRHLTRSPYACVVWSTPRGYNSRPRWQHDNTSCPVLATCVRGFIRACLVSGLLSAPICVNVLRSLPVARPHNMHVVWATVFVGPRSHRPLTPAV